MLDLFMFRIGNFFSFWLKVIFAMFAFYIAAVALMVVFFFTIKPAHAEASTISTDDIVYVDQSPLGEEIMEAIRNWDSHAFFEPQSMASEVTPKEEFDYITRDGTLEVTQATNFVTLCNRSTDPNVEVKCTVAQIVRAGDQMVRVVFYQPDLGRALFTTGQPTSKDFPGGRDPIND